MYVVVSNGEVQFTEEIAAFPGTLTIAGGSYSFWNGTAMEKVSNAPHTFKLGSTYGLWGYEIYRDDGFRTRLCLEADSGLNGVNVSWSVPDMPSLSGQAVFPNYKTTQQQLASFVPYIEFIRSGSQVTGLKWRIVNPSDTSKPVVQDFDMSFQVENASREGWDEFYRSEWIDITAGETPEGTLTFDEPIDESEIWLVEVSLNVHDENTDKIYSWKFSHLDEPVMSLYTMHESEARLVNGKASYNNAKFYGLTLVVETENAILAEAKHFTNEGRITIPGGGYSIRDDDSEEIIGTVASGTDRTFSLNMYNEVHIDQDWLEYILRGEDSRVIVLAEDAETGLNGRIVTWTFPSSLNMNGSAVIPNFKSVNEQLVSYVPYIDVVSADGRITAINYKLVNPLDTSAALQPSYRTDFRISIMHSDGSSTLRSRWLNNTNSGTWTLDVPEDFSNISFILVRMRTYENANKPLSYQWDFAPAISDQSPQQSSGGGSSGGCSTGFTLAAIFLTASLFFTKKH